MGLVDQSCEFSPHGPARQSRHHLQVPGRATLRPVCPGSWKTVNTTERLCQGPSQRLFVQKTDQQHSWKTPRYSFQALSKLPALIITLLLYYLGSAEGVQHLGVSTISCQVTLSEAHCTTGVQFLLVPDLSVSLQFVSTNLFHLLPYNDRHPGLWSWGGAGGRCSSKRETWKIENK